MDITPALDPATLTGCTVLADGITGRTALVKHIDIQPNGLSMTGFQPGIVIELRVPARHGDESRFVYLPYDATIDILNGDTP